MLTHHGKTESQKASRAKAERHAAKEQQAKAARKASEKTAFRKRPEKPNKKKTKQVPNKSRRWMLQVGRMHIPVRIRNDHIRKELKKPIKFCQIVRIPGPDGWIYRLHVAVEGLPEQKYELGEGRVGNDVGYRTWAWCSDSEVSITEIAPGAVKAEPEIKKLQREMDQSVRMTNPDLYKWDGRIIPRDELPEELLLKNGKRNWHYTNNCKRKKWRLKYLKAKQKRIRKQERNALANQLLQQGNEFNVETMNFKELAKRGKFDPDNPRKKRKRGGWSIGIAGPADMIHTIEKKVKARDGTFLRIKTWKAKASQFDPITKTCTKAPLSQRVRTIGYPEFQLKILRDLLSGFLLKHTNATLDGFNQTAIELDFASFLEHLVTAIVKLSEVRLPKSAGIPYRPCREKQH